MAKITSVHSQEFIAAIGALLSVCVEVSMVDFFA
jgi:hypothetical protein